MKKLHWKVLAGLVVGCVFLAHGAVAESETPSLRAQIDELFADRSHSDAPGLLEDGQSADYAAGLFVSETLNPRSSRRPDALRARSRAAWAWAT